MACAISPAVIAHTARMCSGAPSYELKRGASKLRILRQFDSRLQCSLGTDSAQFIDLIETSGLLNSWNQDLHVRVSPRCPTNRHAIVKPLHMASRIERTPGVRDIVTPSAHALDFWLAANRSLYLAAACLVCLMANLGYAHFRVITSDECLQMIIFRQPGVRAIWNSLIASVQADPPVADTAMHYLFRLFGDHLLLARLPSAVTFCLMCLCLSLIVWRYAGAIYGAAAFFMPFATALRSWGSLSRPYAPLLGFSSLALLCWDRLQDPELRRVTRWRVAFIMSLAATFSTHFFSIAILFPLALAELAKWRIRKRLDWPTLLCTPVAFIPYLIWSPILVASARIFLPHPFRSPVIKTLYEFYGDMLFSLPWAGALLMMLLACAYIGPSNFDGPPRKQINPAVRPLMVFCAGCLLLPVCGAVSTAMKMSFYGPRMSLVSLFGLVVGLPLLMDLAGARKAVGLALFAAMAGNAAMVAAQGAMRLFGREAPYPVLAEFRHLIPEPHPDIVIPESNVFLPLVETNREDPENSLLYLFDTAKQLAARGSDTPDVASSIIQGRSRARLLPFDPYLATHSRFYVALATDVKDIDAWQFKYLLNQVHATFRWLGTVKGWNLYSVDLKQRHAGQA
jgi:hypothetical protein